MFLCFKTYNPGEFWTKKKETKEKQAAWKCYSRENVMYVKMLVKLEVPIFLNALLSCV